MPKFGRFEFGKDKAAETYEGDRLELNKDYVKIVNGQPGMIELLGDSTSVVAVIQLDKGQSVREIK